MKTAPPLSLLTIPLLTAIGFFGALLLYANANPNILTTPLSPYAVCLFGVLPLAPHIATSLICAVILSLRFRSPLLWMIPLALAGLTLAILPFLIATTLLIGPKITLLLFQDPLFVQDVFLRGFNTPALLLSLPTLGFLTYAIAEGLKHKLRPKVFAPCLAIAAFACVTLISPLPHTPTQTPASSFPTTAISPLTQP